MFKSRHPAVRSDYSSHLLLISILCFITFISYEPVLRNGFINFDDHVHIIDQPLIKSLSLENLGKIFLTNVNTTYIPLTILSFAVEYHFFKLNPLVYHLDNLLLHLGVVSLIFLFCLELKLNSLTAFTTALLFGLHPMHVESVAWATERKDVLYSLFYVASMLAYLKFLHLKRRNVYYALSLILGLFSMMSKPMAVSLPLILLLIDFLEGRTDIQQCLMDKVPFALYIVPLAKLTHAQNASAYAVDPNGWHALQIFIWTFSFYIHKFLIPQAYFLFYEVPQPTDFPSGSYWFAIGVFLIWMFTLIKYRQDRWMGFNLMFYVCSIFFLLRFERVVNLDAVSDRFMYLPSLGFCILVARYINDSYQKGGIRKLASCLILIFLSLYLFFFTNDQTRLWKNDVTLWTYIIDSYSTTLSSKNILKDHLSMIKPHFYLARTYSNEGRIELAIQEYQRIVDLISKLECKSAFSYPVFFNLGMLYYATHDYPESVEYYTKAIQDSPKMVYGYQNRGKVFLVLGQLENALNDFNQMVELNPDNPDSYFNRSVILFRMDKYDLALSDLDKAIQLNPSNPNYFLNRSVVFKRLNRGDLAERDLLDSKLLRIHKDAHAMP